MARFLGPRIVTSGLVLCLDAANRKSYPGSGTTWFDLSNSSTAGVRNDATMATGVSYINVNGGAINFNGDTPAKATIPAGSDFAYGTGDFTVDGWFNSRAAIPSFGATLFSQTISGTNYFWIYIGDGQSGRLKLPTFNYATSGGGTAIVSGNPAGVTSITDNTWNYFAVTRRSNSVVVYWNLNSSTTATVTQDFSNTTYVPTIGQYTHTAQNRFTGYIGPIRVYKGKGLTPDEIAQNFNAQRQRFGI